MNENSNNMASTYSSLETVNLAFAKQKPLVLDNEPQFNKRPQGKRNRQAYYSQSLKEVHSMAEGAA